MNSSLRSAVTRISVTGLLLLAGCLGTGCRATAITVTSKPSGATVYSRGCGRIGFRWEKKGETPVTFPSRYDSQNTMVKWPDGSRSEIQYSSLIGKDATDIYFEQKVPAGRPLAVSTNRVRMPPKE